MLKKQTDVGYRDNELKYLPFWHGKRIGVYTKQPFSFVSMTTKTLAEAFLGEDFCSLPRPHPSQHTEKHKQANFNLGLFNYQIGHLGNINLVFYSKSPMIYKQTTKG